MTPLSYEALAASENLFGAASWGKRCGPPPTVTFEWLDGRHFLVQHSHNEHEGLPDSISVIGAPEVGDSLVMEYFDSRGVRRTYGISIDDDLLQIWRDAPGFDQRFSATLGPASFEGSWQLARTPGDWKDDLRVTYQRRPNAGAGE